MSFLCFVQRDLYEHTIRRALNSHNSGCISQCIQLQVEGGVVRAIIYELERVCERCLSFMRFGLINHVCLDDSASRILSGEAGVDSPCHDFDSDDVETYFISSQFERDMWTVQTHSTCKHHNIQIAHVFANLVHLQTP